MTYWRLPHIIMLSAVLVMAGCSNRQATVTVPERSPMAVKARIIKLMPTGVRHAPAWADDIYTAFRLQQLAPDDGNLCAVIAVAQQESGFNADAPVSGLPAIAWKEINRRAAGLHIPSLLLRTALRIPSPDGRSYTERLDAVRTEKELSDIFDDFITMVPMGQKLFGNLNPVHTGGPMQVSIAFAQAHQRGYPYTVVKSIRQEVFTRRGGMWFGIQHLLGYPASGYDTLLWRFADFNAGWYASRNAAFQAAVSRVTGISLATDGDLIRYDSDEKGATEQATLTLSRQMAMSEREIRRDLRKGNSDDFSKSELYRKLFALADKMAGRRLPRAILPGIRLQSPKISRKRTTAWFASQVQRRWQQCMLRGGVKN